MDLKWHHIVSPCLKYFVHEQENPMLLYEFRLSDRKDSLVVEVFQDSQLDNQILTNQTDFYQSNQIK